MIAYIKRRSDFKTVVSADAISWDVPLASVGDETGTVVLYGTAVTRGHEGGFLIMAGHIWLIESVTPEDMQTTVAVVDVLNAFDRMLVYGAAGATVGAFIASGLDANYKTVADSTYAMPYLSIENRDATGFTPPAVTDGLYSMKEYIRAVRRTTDVVTAFSVSGNTLRVIIDSISRPTHNIVFSDGHAQLASRSYCRSAVAKVTTVKNGAVVDWYLAADDSISNTEPPIRAEGEWRTIAIGDNDNTYEKAAQALSQNSASHKIEWWNDREYGLFDTTVLRLDGGVMTSHISYIGISSGDSRFYYKSGELATTLTERLKGMET